MPVNQAFWRTIEQAHEYWKDPSVATDVVKKYREFCQPEWYLHNHEASKMFLDVVKRLLPDRASTILELGTNVGRNLYHLDMAGYKNISGIEISRKAVDLGFLNFGDVCANIEVVSIEDYLIDTDDEFDLVFTMGVLLHIHPDSDWVFERIAEVAKKYIITIEGEIENVAYKWARSYEDIFVDLGWRHIDDFVFLPLSDITILRVFENGRI